MDDGLKLVVGADVRQAEKALHDLATGSIQELKQQAKSLKGELAGLDAAMLKSTGGKALASELRAVNAELKVAQKQAGLTGAATTNAFSKSFGAVRTLANILPGIGIAGIFGLAIAGVEKFVTSLLDVKKAFNATALDAELFKKAAVTSTDDVLRMQALVAVAKDVTNSTNQRKNAISELQKLYPDYLGNISLETINSAKATQAIDALTQSIINKALVQEFSTRAAKELIALDEKHDAVIERAAKHQADLAQLEKLRADKNTPADALRKFGGIVDETGNKLVEENRAFEEQSAVVDHLKKKLNELTASSLDFTKVEKPKALKAGKGKLEIDWQFRAKDRGQLETDLQAMFNNISGIVIPEMHIKVAETDAEKMRAQMAEQAFKRGPLQPEIEVDPKLIFRLELMQAALANINQIILSSLQESFTAIGEGIGEILAGGNVASAFQAFMGVIGSAVQAIGKQLIQLGTVALFADKALKSLFKNPAVSIAAGIALVAVGAAMKKVLGGGVQGFAEGGLVFGPTVGLVGEGAGTRRSNPEVIAPLDKLQAMLGGANNRPQRLYAVVRGNDLLLSNARTKKYNTR